MGEMVDGSNDDLVYFILLLTLYLIFTRGQGRNIPCVALSSGGLWGAQCPCPPSRHGRPLTSRTGMLKL